MCVCVCVYIIHVSHVFARYEIMYDVVCSAARKQVDAALAEKKKLVKQKNELITGFRNQMKLVDVLKRQVLHAQMREGGRERESARARARERERENSRTHNRAHAHMMHHTLSIHRHYAHIHACLDAWCG